MTSNWYQSRPTPLSAQHLLPFPSLLCFMSGPTPSSFPFRWPSSAHIQPATHMSLLLFFLSSCTRLKPNFELSQLLHLTPHPTHVISSFSSSHASSSSSSIAAPKIRRTGPLRFLFPCPTVSSSLSSFSVHHHCHETVSYKNLLKGKQRRGGVFCRLLMEVEEREGGEDESVCLLSFAFLLF